MSRIGRMVQGKNIFIFIAINRILKILFPLRTIWVLFDVKGLNSRH